MAISEKFSPSGDGPKESTMSGPGPYRPLAQDENDTGNALKYHLPPIDRLPPPLAEYVASSAEAIGCDPSLVALPALAACAAAIGDSRAMEVKAGWIELSVLWTLAVAPSGALKTPALKAAMQGLESAQQKAYERHQCQMVDYREALALYQKSDKTTKAPELPKLTSYYLGDATLEAVGSALDDNRRGLLQKRDELSGWLGSFDRYSDGNESAQWLEFHSGSPVRIDRKGGEKKMIYLPRALVSVTGTIQEAILRKQLAGDGGKHFDNGLAARFLMAMPPERVREWREAVTPPELVAKYHRLFENLLALAPRIDPETGRRDPVVLHWSPAAKERIVAFVNANGGELKTLPSDRLKSAWSKLEGQAMRLALIFHCIRKAYLPHSEDGDLTVSVGTVDAALAWIKWFKSETHRIYYVLANASHSKLADAILNFAQRKEGRCTARDIIRNRSGAGTPAEVEAAMSSLVSTGFGYWESPLQPSGGRPTRYFCLKPPSD